MRLLTLILCLTLSGVSFGQLNFGARISTGMSQIVTSDIQITDSYSPVLFTGEAGLLFSGQVGECMYGKGQLLISHLEGIRIYNRDFHEVEGAYRGTLSIKENYRTTYLTIPFGINYAFERWGLEIYYQQMFRLQNSGRVYKEGILDGASVLSNNYSKNMRSTKHQFGPRLAGYFMINDRMKIDITSFLGLADWTEKGPTQMQMMIGMEYKIL